MNLICLGISHQTAAVELRELLAFEEREIPAALRSLVEDPSIPEALILNTCNRVEIYAVTPGVDLGRARLEQFLRSWFELSREVELPLYQRTGRETALHLFRVASGLESMVLGETEIFGQIKKAYSLAQEARSTAKTLNQLFQQSFRVGKYLRNNTNIQRGSTSVGSVAVDLAEKVFGDLRSCHVMLMGAGEMSRVVAQSLLSRGAQSVVVSNRSLERARELAGEIGGEAIPFEEWESRAVDTDIIITSTAAPHALIREEHAVRTMRKRRGRPLIVIDIAVPRDVDPAVGRVPDVYLYPIDALSQIADEGRRKREAQILRCQQLLEQYLGEQGIPALGIAGGKEGRVVSRAELEVGEEPGTVNL